MTFNFRRVSYPESRKLRSIDNPTEEGSRKRRKKHNNEDESGFLSSHEDELDDEEDGEQNLTSLSAERKCHSSSINSSFFHFLSVHKKSVSAIDEKK